MRDCISIAGRKIGPGYPAFIIAEAGVNHNGSLKLAKKMVDVAKSSGADAVKFQTFKAKELVTKNAPKAGYQNKAVPGKTQLEMIKELELSYAEFKELFSYSKKKKIIFLSTPFDSESAEFLHKLGVAAFKISSGELTNLPLLIQIAGFMELVILSTGMSNLEEVGEAVRAIYSTGNKKLILLHCTSNYPARFDDVNLKAIETIRKKFNVPIGYSDHTEGIHVAVSAVAMGACVIEKHFTLNCDYHGPDHKSSLEPEKLSEMIKDIRDIEKAMGNGVKAPAKSENEIKKIARKSIVASKDIEKGMRLTEDMLTFKRPGTGIQPKFFKKIINKSAKKSIKKDKLLTWEEVNL